MNSPWLPRLLQGAVDDKYDQGAKDLAAGRQREGRNPNWFERQVRQGNLIVQREREMERDFEGSHGRFGRQNAGRDSRRAVQPRKQKADEYYTLCRMTSIIFINYLKLTPNAL